MAQTVIYCEKQYRPTYHPLFDALWKKLTSEQQREISAYNKSKNTYYVYRGDILNKFMIVGGETKADEGSNCICGVHINNIYYLANQITMEWLDIGSECIQNWFDGDRHVNGTNACYFCGRHNKETKKDCKLCKPKKEMKQKYLKDLFDAWSNGLSPLMDFGKYNGKRISYVVKKEPKYLEWAYRDYKALNMDLKSYIRNNRKVINEQIKKFNIM